MSTTNIVQDLTPSKELALAIKLAAEHHLHQTDKGGNPYILHPIKVMRYTRSDDYQIMAMAILHDTLEDTPLTAEDLVCYGFSQRVISAVVALTKVPGQSPKEYLRGILENWDACRVKNADLRHNTDIRRLKGLGEKDFTRLRKYHTMHVKIKTMMCWYENYPKAVNPAMFEMGRETMISQLLMLAED